MNEIISTDTLDKIDSELRKLGYQFVKNIDNKLVYKREIILNSQKELFIDLKNKGISISYGTPSLVSLTYDEIKTLDHISKILNW